MKFLAQNTALVLSSAPLTWWIHIAIGPSVRRSGFWFSVRFFFFFLFFILYWSIGN